MVDLPGESPRVAHRVRDWIFEQRRYGLIDVHERDWEEPPGNGGFLFNGGRLYLDMGHVEYCTPECASAIDVVRYERAGDRLLLEAVKTLGLEAKVHFIRNNIDHHSGATFGCHENYSLSRFAPFTEANVLSLLAFLTLRLLFAGTGRVGGHMDRSIYFSSRERPQSPSPDFQLSQRADYIQNDLYEWVQHNRAIINTRDEPLADPRRYRRLHLLHGDTNVLPAASYLKVGATRLVLDLLEADDLPPIALADAVGTLRAVSHQPEAPWIVRQKSGGKADAIELLSQFRTRAEAHFHGRDADTDGVLDLWARVESGLAGAPASLVGLVDWVTKKHLLDAFRESEGLAWNDPWMQAQDLEYHHIDPTRSLGLALADMNGPWAAGLEDAAALKQPPVDTRAAARSEWMLGVGDSMNYEVDWHACAFDGTNEALLLDPFQSKLKRE